MTTRTVVVEATEIVCRARHPLADRVPTRFDRPHNLYLGSIPFRAVPTGRILEHADQVRTGCYGAKCHHDKCRKITEYEIVAPLDDVA